MRLRFFPILLLALVACMQSGGGMMLNLYQAPRETSYRAFGPCGCEPFGGVELFSAIGGWTMSTGIGFPVGAAIWLVDVPLSLAGDAVTYPLAVARKHNKPWATWWGEQLTPEEVAEQAEKESEAGPTP